MRRRIIWAVAATAAAAGVLTWLAVLQASMTAGQLATSQAYGAVFAALTVLFVTTTWLWARATGAVAKHLELELRIQATETLLGAVISIGVLTMVPVETIWFGTIRSSALWLTAARARDGSHAAGGRGPGRADRALAVAVGGWAGINVVWYSAHESSEFWLMWGLWCFVRQGMRVARELRVDQSR